MKESLSKRICIHQVSSFFIIFIIFWLAFFVAESEKIIKKTFCIYVWFIHNFLFWYICELVFANNLFTVKTISFIENFGSIIYFSCKLIDSFGHRFNICDINKYFNISSYQLLILIFWFKNFFYKYIYKFTSLLIFEWYHFFKININCFSIDRSHHLFFLKIVRFLFFYISLN